MKKTVKSLIIAASVAAIAGIGAVSFAAWNGSNSELKTENGAVGKITLVGFEENTLTWGSDKLVPYDQEGQLPTNNVKMVELDLGKITAESNQNWTITVKTSAYKNKAGANYTLPVDDTDTEDVNEATVIYGKGATTQISTAPSDLSGWDSLIDGTGLVISGTGEVENQYVYLVLQSSNIADMEMEFTVTCTLALAA